ncbi:MAG: hypothetical protein KJ767_01870, partial [Nanoarchaeota archaeon]|nr:hypothetical protein [Nanoarchaeota archaeon]
MKNKALVFAIALIILLPTLSFVQAQTPGTGECTDSDGGVDPGQYYIKGSVTNPGRVDYCAGNSNTILMEAFCKADGTSSIKDYTCSYGCENGACKSPCTDSDGGKDYFKRGIVTSSGVTAEDTCSGDWLFEYYCNGSKTSGEWYYCPTTSTTSNYVCRAGACLLESLLSTIFSSPDNYFINFYLDTAKVVKKRLYIINPYQEPVYAFITPSPLYYYDENYNLKFTDLVNKYDIRFTDESGNELKYDNWYGNEYGPPYMWQIEIPASSSVVVLMEVKEEVPSLNDIREIPFEVSVDLVRKKTFEYWSNQKRNYNLKSYPSNFFRAEDYKIDFYSNNRNGEEKLIFINSFSTKRWWKVDLSVDIIGYGGNAGRSIWQAVLNNYTFNLSYEDGTKVKSSSWYAGKVWYDNEILLDPGKKVTLTLKAKTNYSIWPYQDQTDFFKISGGLITENYGVANSIEKDFTTILHFSAQEGDLCDEYGAGKCVYSITENKALKCDGSVWKLATCDECPGVCPLVCTDTDGGKNYDIKGKVNGTNASGVWNEVTDYCRTTNVLREYYCAPSISLTRYTSTDYTCPLGCSDGKCKKEQIKEGEICTREDGACAYNGTRLLKCVTTSTGKIWQLATCSECSCGIDEECSDTTTPQCREIGEYPTDDECEENPDWWGCYTDGDGDSRSCSSFDIESGCSGYFYDNECDSDVCGLGLICIWDSLEC